MNDLVLFQVAKALGEQLCGDASQVTLEFAEPARRGTEIPDDIGSPRATDDAEALGQGAFTGWCVDLGFSDGDHDGFVLESWLPNRNPMDQQFLSFVGVDYADLRAQLEAGAGDGEVLRWIADHARTPRQPWEIEAWNRIQETGSPVPGSPSQDYFVSVRDSHDATREDLRSWLQPSPTRAGWARLVPT